MKKLLLSLLCVLPLTAMDSGLVKVQKQSVFAPHDLGEVDLYHGSKGFSVLKDGEFKRVQSYNVDANLRKITPEQLARFRAVGYLALKQMNDGEYKIDAKVRGLGGFLLTGVIVHQSCRVIGYTGLILGSASTIIAATAAGGPIGGFTAASAVISASTPAVAAIESGALTIGVAASWIPLLP